MKRKLFALASTLFLYVGIPLLWYPSFSVFPIFTSLMLAAWLLTIAFKNGYTFIFMMNRSHPAWYFEKGIKERLSTWTWNSLFPIRLGIGWLRLAIYHVDVEFLVNYLSVENAQLGEFKKQHIAVSTPKRGSVAVNSSGFVGLIANDNKQEITFRDGNKGFAYVGIQLFKDEGFVTTHSKGGNWKEKAVHVKVGWKWSSRNPRVIGEIDLDYLPHASGLGDDGWNALYRDHE